MSLSVRLAAATPIADAAVRLIASNNEILGDTVTNGDGYARFEPGLARGKGGMAPRIVDVTSSGDFAFLDIDRSAFDLTDRGVEGRAAPGPLDVFLTSERGIYRPGETVYLTALVRDAKANAVVGLPMTLVVERPDGVELDRWTVMDGGAGGYSSSISLDDNAMRGSWRVRFYADPKGKALADLAILVEDFEPERIAFEIDTAAMTLTKDKPTEVEVSARYLYGADAPGLRVTGDVAIRPVSSNENFPGFAFGLADDSLEALRFPIDAITDTDQTGAARLAFDLPELPATTRPLEAEIILRLTDTNGRAVERRLSRPIEATGRTIGIKPLFEGGDVAEGGPARFEAIAVAPDGTRIAAGGLEWTVDRIETNYQWYRQRGNWRYEPVTTSRRVAAGSIDTSIDEAARIEAPVDWGRYRLTITSAGTSAGADTAASSFDFKAGWYVAATSVDTPDVLAVALDKPTYAIGETAKLRLDPRFAGIALISIIDNRVIAMKAVEVPEEGSVVELEVTEAWGPGAYIAASLYRPMDIAAKRMPARAMGIAWAEVSPGDRKLSVSLDIAEEMRPARRDDGSRLDRQSTPRRQGFCHARRGRCWHIKSHPVQTPGAGQMVFRPAPARHGDPRSLRPSDRPDAGRARNGAFRRATASPSASTLRRRRRNFSPFIRVSSRSTEPARQVLVSTCRPSTGRCGSWPWRGPMMRSVTRPLTSSCVTRSW